MNEKKNLLARRPVLGQIFLLFLAFLAFLLYLVPEQGADPDFWGRLSVPAYYYQTGHLPRLDPFSYTAYHHPWIDHEWLSGFLFYWILVWFGEPGLLVFKYLLAIAAFAVLFSLRRRCHPDTSPFYIYYGLALLGPVYDLGYAATLRCQTFSFLFLIDFLWVLEQIRLKKSDGRLFFLLLPITAVWANLHGGVILGLILLLTYGVGETIADTADEALREKAPFWKRIQLRQSKPYFLSAAGLLLIVGICNPYGWVYVKYLIYALGLDRSQITEWRPLPFNVFYWQTDLLILFVLLLMCVHIALLRGKSAIQRVGSLKKLLTPSAVLLLLMAMTLKSLRFQPFFAFAFIAYLPILLPPAWLESIRQAGLGTADWLEARLKFLGQSVRALTQGFFSLAAFPLPVMLGLASVLMLVTLPANSSLFYTVIPDEMNADKSVTRYPVAALRFLQDSPYHGRLMNPFTLGEFIYWNLYPKFRVAIDGRYEEIYPQRVFGDINRFNTAGKSVNRHAVEMFLRLYHPDFILQAADAPIVSAVLNTGDWTNLYADHDFVVLGRKAVLASFPTFISQKIYLTTQMLTIRDFFHPADLKRFGEIPNFIVKD